MVFCKVYLCGPINGCSDDEACNWRNWFKRTNTAEYLDPMVRDYRGRELTDYREIVELDKRDIRSCDYLIVMYTKPSVGTSMEIFMAWSLGIPVIVIDESTGPISPWMTYHSTAIVKTKREALGLLEKWSIPSGK